MLARISTIKKAQDFQMLFKEAKSFKNQLFVLKLLRNGSGKNRFAFIVSQKVSKKATARNKVRRRLAEAVRAEFENMESGLDIVLIALPGIEKKEFADIGNALSEAIYKTGITKKKG